MFLVRSPRPSMRLERIFTAYCCPLRVSVPTRTLPNEPDPSISPHSKYLGNEGQLLLVVHTSASSSSTASGAATALGGRIGQPRRWEMFVAWIWGWNGSSSAVERREAALCRRLGMVMLPAAHVPEVLRLENLCPRKPLHEMFSGIDIV